MEIEVSAFGNFSTDTGSTDCNQVNINVFRFRRSRPSVLHGANFIFVYDAPQITFAGDLVALLQQEISLVFVGRFRRGLQLFFWEEKPFQ